MHLFPVALICTALIACALPAAAEDDKPEGCAAEGNCVPPVYVDPAQEAEDEAAPERPAIHCEGMNCLPPEDNPVEACEGENCVLQPPAE